MANQYCTALSTRTDFDGYVALLKNITGGNFSLVSECREEVCGALWGSGNPDISGIGMTIGYLLERLMSACFTCAHIWQASSKRGHHDRHLRRWTVAAGAFYDNAVFFSFAIQLASVVTLARANFGVSADGMRAITMKIAWTVSTLTLLPLTPFILRPQLFGNRSDAGAHTANALSKIQTPGKEEDENYLSVAT